MGPSRHQRKPLTADVPAKPPKRPTSSSAASSCEPRGLRLWRSIGVRHHSAVHDPIADNYGVIGPLAEVFSGSEMEAAISMLSGVVACPQ